MRPKIFPIILAASCTLGFCLPAEGQFYACSSAPTDSEPVQCSGSYCGLAPPSYNQDAEDSGNLTYGVFELKTTCPLTTNAPPGATCSQANYQSVVPDEANCGTCPDPCNIHCTDYNLDQCGCGASIPKGSGVRGRIVTANYIGSRVSIFSLLPRQVPSRGYPRSLGNTADLQNEHGNDERNSFPHTALYRP
jgi:hypothetical protein